MESGVLKRTLSLEEAVGRRFVMETYREQMQRDIVLRNLSPKTQYLYHNAALVLEDHFSRPPDQLNEDEVKAFLVSIVEDRKLSRSSLKMIYSR